MPIPIKHTRSITRFQRVSAEKLAMAKAMRRTMTAAEKCFWNACRANKIDDMHFHRQQVIDGFIVDFYCADHRFIVKIDGGIHRFQIDYDLKRDEALAKNGLRIIRFTNEEVLQRLDVVIGRVKEMKLLQ